MDKMAREKGPVKGSILVVNGTDAAAASTLLMVEPIKVTAAVYATITGGTMELRGQVVKDAAGYMYVNFTANEEASVASSNRTDGATKGQICVMCEENASSTVFMVEPVVIDDATIYNNIVTAADTGSRLDIELFLDAATGIRYCGAGVYTPT